MDKSFDLAADRSATQPGRRVGTWSVWLALGIASLSACDRPWLPDPAATARAADGRLRADLERQLRALPEVARAEVHVDRAAMPPQLSAVVVARTGGPVTDLEAVARRVIAAATPNLPADTAIVVARAPSPTPHQQVGPFAVAPQSARGLRLTLVGALLAIAALAGALAYQARRRPGAQRGISAQ